MNAVIFLEALMLGTTAVVLLFSLVVMADEAWHVARARRTARYRGVALARG